jgi:hypothetical protein
MDEVDVSNDFINKASANTFDPSTASSSTANPSTASSSTANSSSVSTTLILPISYVDEIKKKEQKVKDLLKTPPGRKQW